MNGTIIDIPGITVHITSHELLHSTDMAHTIVFKDSDGKTLKIIASFGRITDFELNPKK